jgi:thiamine biosynthesis lipoprotein
MGTTASVHINDEISNQESMNLVTEVQNELERIEALFSVFRPSSEISRINTGELHLLDTSSDVLEVMDKCSWLEQVSGSAFSVRRSRSDVEIDPSGFVKGWAAERASQLLIERGLRHFYVGIGGDISAVGGLTDNDPWQFGIADPRDPSMFAATVDIVDGAVATSGSAERGHHIWDPRRGESPRHFLSVTVVGPSVMWADAYATTVFVMGEEGREWLQQFDGYSMFSIPAV